MSKIAVFGSAFNPPSVGHQSVIESLAHFDRVLLLPSIAHAWGKQMLEYSDRCQLVDLFIQDLQANNVERSTIEENLLRPEGSVTTFAVLEALEKLYPDSELTFVIGPDNLLNFSKFYKADEIVSRWSVLCCPEKVQVRSTNIRDALQNRKDISHFVTQKVCRMLLEKEYY
ncbi:nicotinic acid mononucleotide adenylyltransferase [Vibrio galatheae]|uniref:nicotinate-nucleotide adenylyltransferase n=1 Tax=Vibrio galatheae TaxID=579748 RepID=A0A0F4NPC1_9VIBR|nr:nicotinate-nicotinamide nucleotide adenylyltransferase [Vibrio galatheae]KJY84698.1 nicotinic acid mononucleotide adenylyltransferase [Vibrio galatheae]